MTDMSNEPLADSEIYDGDLDEVFEGVPDLVDRHKDGAQDDVALNGDFEDEIEVDQ